jgi:hypothetical protein
VTGSEDQVRFDVNSQLFAKLRPDVDFGEYTEPNGAKLSAAASYRLLERKVGHGFEGDSSVSHLIVSSG